MASYLLQETSDKLLLEDATGDLLLETSTTDPTTGHVRPTGFVYTPTTEDEDGLFLTLLLALT